MTINSTSYHTLLTRRIRALQPHVPSLELKELGETAFLRLKDGGRSIVSPTLKWDKLYWWLDGWLTAHEIHIPAPPKPAPRRAGR